MTNVEEGGESVSSGEGGVDEEGLLEVKVDLLKVNFD